MYQDNIKPATRDPPRQFAYLVFLCALRALCGEMSLERQIKPSASCHYHRVTDRGTNMTTVRLSEVLRDVRGRLAPAGCEAASDAALLEGFLARRDEAAFA